jgi:hypothetical protein
MCSEGEVDERCAHGFIIDGVTECPNCKLASQKRLQAWSEAWNKEADELANERKREEIRSGKKKDCRHSAALKRHGFCTECHNDNETLKERIQRQESRLPLAETSGLWNEHRLPEKPTEHSRNGERTDWPTATKQSKQTEKATIGSEGRYNYVIPSPLFRFNGHYSEKCEDFLNIGLNKLKDTVVKVDELRKSLAIKN